MWYKLGNFVDCWRQLRQFKQGAWSIGASNNDQLFLVKHHSESETALSTVLFQINLWETIISNLYNEIIVRQTKTISLFLPSLLVYCWFTVSGWGIVTPPSWSSHFLSVLIIIIKSVRGVRVVRAGQWDEMMLRPQLSWVPGHPHLSGQSSL